MTERKRSTLVPKLGRPTADQALAISRAIISAATELFLAEGFEGATMEAVAVHAGVPKTTLYKRYPDKRALLRAVLQERVAAWGAVASQKKGMLTDDLGQRLKHHLTTIVEWAAAPEVRSFAALAAGAWSGPKETAHRFDVFGHNEMIDILERDILTFGPAMGIHAKNARRVATVLMAMAAGWLALRGSGTPATEQDGPSFADSAVDLLLRGSAAW